MSLTKANINGCILLAICGQIGFKFGAGSQELLVRLAYHKSDQRFRCIWVATKET